MPGLTPLRPLALAATACLALTILNACAAPGEDDTAPPSDVPASEADAPADSEAGPDPDAQDGATGDPGSDVESEASDPGAPQAAAPATDCPDLTGTWTSAPYDVLRVDADHGEELVGGYVSVFEVAEQEGCTFSGRHSWHAGDDAEERAFIGSLDPGAGELAIIEPGASARYTGRVDGDTMDMVFREVSRDRSSMLVYGSRLARGEETPELAACPALAASWRSGPYDVLSLPPEGEAEVSGGYTTTLTVESQHGCLFRARDAWEAEGETGAAPLAGVLHPDGTTLSLVEIPEADGGSPVALLEGRVTGDDRLDLRFLGEMSDGASDVIAFAVSYGTRDEPPSADDCPDVTGTWLGGPFVAHRVTAEGERFRVQRTSRELAVLEQNGCLIHGENRWSGEDGTMNAERFAGVVDADSGAFTILELDPHPADGTSAWIVSRPLGVDTVLSAYLGHPDDGSYAQVFAERLTR